MSQYPSLFLKNQFGETINAYVVGGSQTIDCNFIVDSTNGNGLGIRSLKGSPLVSNVYMHTSATPAAGNPNPEAGLILVELAQGFSGYVGGYGGFGSPVSGTPINVTTGVTAGLAYVITSLGTTSTAQWQVLGVPTNQTPAVGLAFVASATVTATGTGTIEVPAAAGSTVGYLDIIGDPNQSCLPSGGGYFVSRCMQNGAIATPANNSVVQLRIVMLQAPANLL